MVMVSTLQWRTRELGDVVSDGCWVGVEVLEGVLGGREGELSVQ